ncbi:MAG TPA: DinB family protein [Longimicrobiaceae bacterium]
MFPLAEIYRLNTRLLHNCLDGLTEEQGQARPVAAANSAAFVAAHLADTRFAIAAWLGAPRANPLAAALADARGIDDVRDLPTLAEIRAAWDAASRVVEERLAALTASELDAPAPERFPAGGPTLLGALAFLAQHDSYHVGQLALLRKAAGLPAMRYAERPSGNAG